MLNYWVALVIAVILILVSRVAPEYQLYVRALIEHASEQKDIDRLRRILFKAKVLLVVVWGAMLYLLACLVKFIVSLF